MSIPVLLKVETMHVTSSPTGKDLTRILESVEAGRSVKVVLGVAVGLDERGGRLMGTVEFRADERCRPGLVTSCILRGNIGRTRAEARLFFEPTQALQGTVIVLN